MTKPESTNRGCSFWLVGLFNPKTVIFCLLFFGPAGGISAVMVENQISDGTYMGPAMLVGLACGFGLGIAWCWPRERLDISQAGDADPHRTES